MVNLSAHLIADPSITGLLSLPAPEHHAAAGAGGFATWIPTLPLKDGCSLGQERKVAKVSGKLSGQE